ncbi:MAG: hypothetical protein AAF496_00470 [Pseudomonadota bacterium]
MGSVSQPSHGSPDNRIAQPAGHSLLAECDFDEFETNVLDIARHFFLAFAEPESEAWVEAFRRAELMFPAPFGATIANAILIALNDMRQSRVRLFTYSNPRCDDCLHHITDEERYFISALRDMRRSNRGAVETNCMLLCEGNDASDLLASLERIAIITGDVEDPKYN